MKTTDEKLFSDLSEALVVSFLIEQVPMVESKEIDELYLANGKLVDVISKEVSKRFSSMDIVDFLCDGYPK